MYSKASSQENFIELLRAKGHEIYKRGNQLGIKKIRNHRLANLGYPMEKLQLLDQKIERNKRLSQVRKLRNRRSKDRGFDRER